MPEEEKYLNTEAELRDMLVGLVGGRAAEEVVFDTVTTGAANDIEKATDIARNMITRYGMSKKFGLVGLATVESQYLEGRTALNCSDTTAAMIDEEVVEILKESYDKALELLRENREVMDKLAEFLIEKETITGKEFMEIFRREKGLPEPEEGKPGEKGAESGQVADDRARQKAAPSGQTAAETSVQDALQQPGQDTAPQAVENTGESAGSGETVPNAIETESSVEEADSADAENDAHKAQIPAEEEHGPDSQRQENGREPEGMQNDSHPVGRFSNGRID